MNKIKNYYMFYIPIMILNIAATFLYIKYLNIVDYGQYSLYTIYISYFTLVGFGVIDGILLKYRKKTAQNLESFNVEIAQLIISQVIMLIVFLILFFIFDFNILYLIAFMSAIVTNVIGSYKAALQGTNGIVKFNLIELAQNGLIMLNIVLFVVFKMQLINLLWLDLLFRIIIVVVLVTYSLRRLPFDRSEIFGTEFNYLELLINGLPIAVSDWVLIALYGIDKVVLQTNVQELGIYAVASKFVFLFVLLIIPLKNLFLINISKKISEEKIVKLSINILVICFALIIGFKLFLQIAVYAIPLLNELQPAFDVLNVTLLTVPVLILLEILYINLLKLRNSKWYLTAILTTIILSFLSLELYVNTVEVINLNIYGLIVLSNYLLLFIICTSKLLSWKNIGKILAIYSLLTVGYALSFFHIILEILIICRLLFAVWKSASETKLILQNK